MRDQFDVFKDSQIVICSESNQVLGFAMYDVKDSEVTVISFNLKHFNNFKILSTLLNAIFNDLQTTVIDTILSRAHHTNIKSLNFHRRMGFKEVGRTEQHIEFQTTKQNLLDLISRRLPVIM